MVGRVGLEPTTYGLKVRCYYQLSYRPIETIITSLQTLSIKIWWVPTDSNREGQ